MKNKKGKRYLGQVFLSSPDYHGILRPSFVIRESIRVVFTMHFLVLKCRVESQDKRKGENPHWTCSSHSACTHSRESSAPVMEKQGRMKAKQSQRKGDRVKTMLHVGKSL